MKKLKLLSLLLCVLLLCACSLFPGSSPKPSASPAPTPVWTPAPTLAPSPTLSTPAPGQFVFTRENFPRMDGSTSLAPLARAAASVLLGETTDQVADLVNFNRTTQSYRNLMYGSCDIVISGEPAETIWGEFSQNSFEIDRAQIATDALVFVVNANNPVNSLTVEQLQKIYTGEITNWAEVGGDDVDIIPFQRNAESGSQAAMQKEVMGDLTMMTPPADYLISEMQGLIEAVRNYDNSTGAIGYSVYYYVNDMKMAEGLKILNVNGVEPTDATIRSGEYPLLTNLYTAVAKTTPEDAPARVLYNWLQSGEGQALVSAMGYVSVKG